MAMRIKMLSQSSKLKQHRISSLSEIKPGV